MTHFNATWSGEPPLPPTRAEKKEEVTANIRRPRSVLTNTSVRVDIANFLKKKSKRKTDKEEKERALPFRAKFVSKFNILPAIKLRAATEGKFFELS